MKLWPLETVSNVIQMLVLLALVILLWFRAGKTKNPTIVRFFTFGLFSYFMGDVFWSLYLMLMDKAPDGFSAADIAWLGSYCLLTGIMQMMGVKGRGNSWIVWLVTAFVAANAVSWNLLWSDNYLSNCLWGIVIVIFSWYATAGLCLTRGTMRPFYISLEVMLLIELIMFQSWGIVYTLMDFALTLNMVIMPVILLRCIERSPGQVEEAVQ